MTDHRIELSTSGAVLQDDKVLGHAHYQAGGWRTELLPGQLFTGPRKLLEGVAAWLADGQPQP